MARRLTAFADRGAREGDRLPGLCRLWSYGDHSLHRYRQTKTSLTEVEKTTRQSYQVKTGLPNVGVRLRVVDDARS